MANKTVEELDRLAAEERMRLPRRAYEIAVVEAAGAMVDLETGAIFAQHDNWVEFARLWVCEMVRRGVVPEEGRLAKAIARANGKGYHPKLCESIAVAALALVLRESAGQEDPVRVVLPVGAVALLAAV